MVQMLWNTADLTHRIKYYDTICLQFDYGYDRPALTFHVPKELILSRSVRVKDLFERHKKGTPFVAEIELGDYYIGPFGWRQVMVDVANAYVRLLMQEEVMIDGCEDVSMQWMRLVDLYNLTEHMEDSASTNMVINELKSTLRTGMPSTHAILHSGDSPSKSISDSVPRRLIVGHMVEHGELPKPSNILHTGKCDLWEQIARAMVAARHAPVDRTVFDEDEMDRRYNVPT